MVNSDKVDDIIKEMKECQSHLKDKDQQQEGDVIEIKKGNLSLSSMATTYKCQTIPMVYDFEVTEEDQDNSSFLHLKKL